MHRRQGALAAEGSVDPRLIGLVTSRSAIDDLLKLDDVVDLVIPRGSNALVRCGRCGSPWRGGQCSGQCNGQCSGRRSERRSGQRSGYARLPILQTLRPLDVGSASALCPLCVRSAPALRPLCVRHASALLPLCAHSVSLCVRSASALCPQVRHIQDNTKIPVLGHADGPLYIRSIAALWPLYCRSRAALYPLYNRSIAAL